MTTPAPRLRPSLYIGEGSGAVIVIQNASPVLRNVDVREAVAIVVADSDPLAVASARHAGFFCYVGKCSVSIIVIQRVAQRRTGVVEIAFAAVH